MAMESPTNDFGKGAKGAKAATGFAQKTRQFIQVAKVLVKGGAGPAGWAVAAAQILAPLIKKIKKAAAILGGVIALRILMHIMQLAGLVAGLAFGAISGLPLLLIPVAGPFLYVGWVGFWGYRGFTNPFDTIQLATHPWELITRPLSWLGQRFSNLGTYFKGGTEYIGSGVGNAASTVFYGAANFVTGLGQSLLGGIASTAGNFAGWLSGFAGNVFGAASATLTSSASGIIGVAGKITMVAVGAGSFLVAATNIVQLSTIEGDIPQDIIGQPPATNDILTVTKTVDQPTIGNLGGTVTFSIKIDAKKNIKSLTLNDTLTRKVGTTNPAVSCTPQAAPPVILASGASCTGTFPLDVDNIDSNSVITNTITVAAIAEDNTTASASSTATVRVGTPSSTDPSGWPTCGVIGQGPWMNPTHLSPGFQSSIDIENAEGTRIYATHDGTVTAATTDRTGAIYVAVRGTNYISFYAHLLSIDSAINVGDTIAAGTLVGLMDTTGDFANLSHLHYMIRDINNIEISAAAMNALAPGYSLFDTVVSSYGGC